MLSSLCCLSSEHACVTKFPINPWRLSVHRRLDAILRPILTLLAAVADVSILFVSLGRLTRRRVGHTL